MTKTTAKSSYGSDAIQTLSGRQHVQRRASMYIGSVDAAGVQHLLKEVADNAIDEYQNGHATEFSVTLDKGCNTATVVDDGRGIPVGLTKSGKNSLTVAVSELQSGGKFDDKTYGTSAGLHGVGIKATCFLSKEFVVTVWRDGHCWQQTFHEGEPTTKVVEAPARKKERKHGTEIRFTPSEKFFKGFTPFFNAETIRSWLSSLVHICPGLTVHYTHDGKTKTYVSEKGVAGYVAQRAKREGKELLHNVVQYTGKTLSFAFAWVNSPDPLTIWMPFVNRSPTPEGGTHVQGFKRALGKALSETSKRYKASTDDLCDGLLALISCAVVEPKFKGQTKGALGNPEVEKMVFDESYAFLRGFFAKGPGKALAKTIVERAVELGKIREQTRRLRKVVAETTSKGGVLPSKLARATKCQPHERELFIVEGDSAGGPAKEARDSRYQEILPLRGKFLNAGRAETGKFLASEEVKNMLLAIGVKVNPKDSKLNVMTSLRQGKIFLLMDADPDGKHIESLSLILITRYLPQLIESGMVYVIRSPLFKAVSKDGKSRWYADSLEAIGKKSGKDPSTLLVSRLKGHGEASAAELKEYAISPLSRSVYKVEAKGSEYKLVAEVMGDDANARKRLLGIEVPDDPKGATVKALPAPKGKVTKALPAPKTKKAA